MFMSKEEKEYVLQITSTTDGKEIMKTNKGVYQRPIGTFGVWKPLETFVFII